MNDRPSLLSWLWRVVACGLVLVLAQMIGAPLLMALGVDLPRMPGEPDPQLQLLLLVPGAIVMALALALMAVGLAGRGWQRWAILASFVFVVHGVANALETRIFTTLGGDLGAALIPLPVALLGALVVVRLFPAPSDEPFGSRLRELFGGWSAGRLAGRLALAIVAFPFFYFLFGLIVAPIVTPHYARLEFLVIPPMPTILAVAFIRSVLFLLVSLPVVVAWRESRGRLLLGLSAGHFAAVGLVGLIQAPFFPAVLRWTHGIEILADSVCYAAALVWLFFPRRAAAAAEEPEVLRERLV